jgi:hypothetical protein
MSYLKERVTRPSRTKRKFRAAAGNGIASLFANLLSSLSFFCTLKERLLVSKANGSDNGIGRKHERVSERVFSLLNTPNRRYCRDVCISLHCLCIIICMI